jgi:hypothetical protein
MIAPAEAAATTRAAATAGDRSPDLSRPIAAADGDRSWMELVAMNSGTGLTGLASAAPRRHGAIAPFRRRNAARMRLAGEYRAGTSGRLTESHDKSGAL